MNVELNLLRNEVEKLKRLEHHNIIKYLQVDITPDNRTIDLLFEYMPGGSVRNLLDKFGPLDEKIIKIYMKQILEGLKYLHENNIAHNNLKCSNILVANEGTIKLSDFAITKRIITSKITPKENACTLTDRVVEEEASANSLFWMAPEVIKSTGGDKSADVWSLGCVMVEMRTGNPPWIESGSDPNKILEKIANSPDGPQLPTDSLSPLATSWLHRCFEKRPEHRPTIKELLDDPFIVTTDETEDLQFVKRMSIAWNDDLRSSDIIPEERKSIGFCKWLASNVTKTNSVAFEDASTSKENEPFMPYRAEPKPIIEDPEAKAKEERRKKLEAAFLEELQKRRQQGT